MLNIEMQLLTDEYNAICFSGMGKVSDKMKLLAENTSS